MIVHVSKPLTPKVEEYKQKRSFVSASQAANELIRIGLETEEKRK